VLVRDPRERVEARTRAAREDDALHAAMLTATRERSTRTRASPRSSPAPGFRALTRGGCEQPRSRCRREPGRCQNEANHPPHALTVARIGYRSFVMGTAKHRRPPGRDPGALRGPWQVRGSRGFSPVSGRQCDCYRTDDPPTLHVVVELPGVDLATLEVVASGQTVVISGNRERPTSPAARYLAMEIDYGTFKRASSSARRPTRRARPRPTSAACSR